MTDAEFQQRILDNVTVYLDRPLTVSEFMGTRETTVAAYLAEVDTVNRAGSFYMAGIQSFGGDQTPENPYGRGGVTVEESGFSDEIGNTLKGFMFAGSATYDADWCTRFQAFVAVRMDKERTAFWEKVQAERQALGLDEPVQAEGP